MRGKTGLSRLLPQAKHEQELLELRSQLDAQEEKAGSMSQELAAAEAALSTAEQVRPTCHAEKLRALVRHPVQR